MFLFPGSRAGRPFSRHTARQPLQTTQQTQGRSNLYAAPFDALAFNGIQVNGSMEVSQENGSTQVTLATGVAKYVVDCWQEQYGHTAGTAVFKGQQVGPPGSPFFGNQFVNCLQMTATTLFTVGNAADFARLQQPIEGYRWGRLGYGSSVAQPVTIGFCIYTSVTGTASLSILGGGGRCYVVNFAVTAALTWQYVEITIPGDTAGTWATGTSSAASMFFCFGAGSSFQGTAGVWAAGSNFATAATTNFFASTNNTVCLTGVTIMPGIETASAVRSPLILREFGNELFESQRYFYPLLQGIEYIGLFQCYATTNAFGGYLPYGRTMRAGPTISVSASSHFALSQAGSGDTGACTAITMADRGQANAAALSNATVPSGVVAGNATHLHSLSASATIFADARY